MTPHGAGGVTRVGGVPLAGVTLRCMYLALSAGGAALTARLVDIASVSGGEAALAGMIEAALRELPHVSVDRDGSAVVARTHLGRAERVVIAGHIDTVPIADNLPSRQDGRRLYGCGATDMKGGVAVALRLAATVTEPRRDTTFVFYDCEEIEAERNGLLRLSRHRPDWLAGGFARLVEPTHRVVGGGGGRGRPPRRSWQRSGGRRGPNSAGPTSPCSRRSACPRSTTGRESPRSRTRRASTSSLCRFRSLRTGCGPGC